MSSDHSELRIHFGTSGFRGRWGIEYTEATVRATAQGICEYLKEEDLGGAVLVVGYDSRLHADQAARWAVQVCLANGFRVHLAERDTPTPALAYYATVALAGETVAGIINCTASHNPVNWHGIKFSPGSGEPAPPTATEAVARHANRHLANAGGLPRADLDAATSKGQLLPFDPRIPYCKWLLAAGETDLRVPIDVNAIADYFTSKRAIVVDELHGAGRGYLPYLLDHIGVPYTVLHGTKDPMLGGLHAANPEDPNIDLLKQTVVNTSAAIGIGLDTDADRFGVVAADGSYIWPNQILSLLTYSLGVDRGLNGRVSISYVSTRLADDIAADIPDNDLNQPLPGSLPPHMREDGYRNYVGNLKSVIPRHAFYVPTGLKNLVRVGQMDRDYQIQVPRPEHWMDNVLLAGEESSGLTTRGHIPDKDGMLADLLILDLIARYRSPLHEVWDDVTSRYWRPTFSRIFLPANADAPSALIDKYLTECDGTEAGTKTFAGCPIVYLGGVPGQFAEFRLADASGSTNNYLQIRPSGTEPLVRVYLETSSDATQTALYDQIHTDAANA